MVIEIERIKKTKEEIEKEEAEKLIKDFNREAEILGIDYRMILDRKSCYARLVKKFFIFEKEINILFLIDDKFIFDEIMDEEVLEKIKPVLENIPERVKVVLREKQ